MSVQLANHVKAILFDMDGTLVDTDNMVVDRLANRLRPIFRQRSRAVARWALMRSESPGNSLVTWLDRLGLDERAMELTDRLRRRRGVYPASEFRLIDGTEEMIHELSQRYALAIVTTRSRYHIERFYERFPQLRPLFAVSCGLQDTRRLKPHPEPVLLAAERLAIPVSHCLMVGDTTVDIRAGRNAGAWTVGVLCGFGERSELTRAGADAILATTSHLGPLLSG
ncbi:MAG: HAD family hydrolase [Candidatus Promineifilaceae bacterium]|nr:HAD family hydrolase [Candidatus Promineifilaceae bacterium]